MHPVNRDLLLAIADRVIERRHVVSGSDQRSAISDQRSAISDQRSAISDQRSAISDQRSETIVTCYAPRARCEVISGDSRRTHKITFSPERPRACDYTSTMSINRY